MTVRHLAVPAYTVPAVGGGPVAFRSSSNTTYASGRTSTTITPPSGIVDGDQLIFVLILGSSSAPTSLTGIPSGLISLAFIEVGTSFVVRMHIWGKTAASESGNYVFTHSSYSTQGVCLCYSGVDTNYPLDGPLQLTSGEGTTTSANGLMTVTANTMVLFVEHDFGDNTTDRTPPTGMTERVDVRPLVYVSEVAQTAAGATGTKSHTNNNNGTSPWGAIQLALRQAGTAEPRPFSYAAVAGPRNGTTSHTVDPSSGEIVAGKAFTPTAGRLLVCVVAGGVTSTTPSGWTLPSGGSSVNVCGLYVFRKTAAGSDILITTHNASNWPVMFHFFELSAGSTFGSSVGGNGSANAANPTLSGITGAPMVVGVKVRAIDGSGGTASMFGMWDSTNIKLIDHFVPYATTGGYGFTIAYQLSYSSSSYTPTNTQTGGNTAADMLTFSVNVV